MRPPRSRIDRLRDANTERAIEIALAAQTASVGLDADRSKIYFDLIMNSLGEAARHALITMDAQKYEYQSDFARHYMKRSGPLDEALAAPSAIAVEHAKSFRLDG